MSWKIVEGDCVEAMRSMDECSVDAVVCDPPYGLKFMGKQWDDPGAFVERRPDRSVSFDRIGGNHNPTDSADAARTRGVENRRQQEWHYEWAREALRVLKPGGHMLVFGGTRTYHRLACALEDAGFEIRDCLVWIYGSGFPKSLDVSKAIDRAAGAEREVVGKKMAGIATPGDVDRHTVGGSRAVEVDVTVPATDAAKQWEGWGSALKPAHEPIVMARKPLIGTVAGNVQEHGTGALNVDGCRIPTDENPSGKRRMGAINHLSSRPAREAEAEGKMESRQSEAAFRTERAGEATGRWPPNVLLGHADCCGDECGPCCSVAELDRQSGWLNSGSAGGASRGFRSEYVGGTNRDNGLPTQPKMDAGGGASRFFPRFRYVAKASGSERNAGLEGMAKRWLPTMGDGIGGREYNEIAAPRVENYHPTVKPVDLMRWLCRLITPPGGLVLDPFAGSGTTGIAAIWEDLRFVGIEREPEYAEIARRRIAWAASHLPEEESVFDALLNMGD